MLEKLLELLLSAKSGAVAAVFLIGTTGALITATVENGVTTITVTPNASPALSASPSPTETASASPSPTETASASPTNSSSPSSAATNCSDQAHLMNSNLQKVNLAYSQYHSALQRLKEHGANATLSADVVTADTTLKAIRKTANDQIHALFTCAKGADEDSKDSDSEDNDEQQVSTASASPNTSASPSPSSSTSPSPSTSTSPLVTVTGSDPKAVADSAVAAMKAVFDAVSAELQTAAPVATHRPDSTNSGFGRGKKHDD